MPDPMNEIHAEFDVDVEVIVAGKIRVKVWESDLETGETLMEGARRLAEDAANDGEFARPNSGFEIVDIELGSAKEVEADA